MALDREVMILYAVINGFLDDVPVDKVRAFEENFQRFMEASHPEVGKRITEEKKLSPETEEALKAAISQFKKTGSV